MFVFLGVQVLGMFVEFRLKEAFGLEVHLISRSNDRASHNRRPMYGYLNVG